MVRNYLTEERAVSLDDIDKVARCAEEIRGMIQSTSMKYDTAVAIERTLAAIVTLSARVKMYQAEEIKAHLDIIEGLMANWPHTEISAYYKAGAAPVLMKGEALKRGSDAIKFYST